MSTSCRSVASNVNIFEVSPKHNPAPSTVAIKDWPTEPKLVGGKNTLDSFLEITEVIWDVTTALCSIVFLVLAFLSVRLDGQMIEDCPWGLDVISASKYGPTVFPILFAMVIGKTLKNIAQWRIECGEKIGVLEQLLGSSTLASTLETQFQLRIFGLLGISLVLLWTLSPLGGQSSLRVLSTGAVTNTTVYNVNYANMFYKENNFSISSSTQSYDNVVINTIFVTALMTPPNLKNSSMDIWGNVKIPLLESFIGNPEDKDGWTLIPSENVTYVSLVGIPLRGLDTSGNTTLKIETPYWFLKCPELELDKENLLGRITNITQNSIGMKDGEWLGQASILSAGNTSSTDHNTYYKYWQISTNITVNGRETPREGLPPRTIMFESRDFNGTTRAKCNIFTTYVEMEVFCQKKNCTVPRMRESNQDNPPKEWTYLDIDYNSFNYKAGGLSQVIQVGQSAASTVIQAFFVNPISPFMEVQGRNMIDSLAKIGQNTFATRLSQLMNTYYLIGVIPYDVQGSDAGVEATTILRGNGKIINSGCNYKIVDASLTVARQRYVCSRVWLVVLVISSFIMVILGLVGALIGAICQGPDILNHISSLTRDNPYTPTPAGGSTMIGGDRARLIRHMKVRLGDVNNEDHIGHIAVGSIDAQYVGRLKRDRKYA